MKFLIKLFSIPVILLFLYSCNAVFLPKKQTITIKTNDTKSTVLIADKKIGTDSLLHTLLIKDGPLQVVVKRPDYKDEFYALIPTKRPKAFWPLCVPDLAFPFFIGFDLQQTKSRIYNELNILPCINKYVPKKNDQKNINLIAIKFNIENNKKDISEYEVSYSYKNDIIKTLEDKEKEVDSKNNSSKYLNNETKFLDSEFSSFINNTLKDLNYIDTINKIFADKNNTLWIEGEIKKVSIFNINETKYSNIYNKNFIKTKLHFIWYIKTSFDEVIDTIETANYSGDFVFDRDHTSSENMLSDVVNISFLNLISNERFKNYLKIDTNYQINDTILNIKTPTQFVTVISDAPYASVIIKRKDGGHGSGFAISNDGYILTNFHVIAGEKLNKLEEIKVVLSTGEEIPVQILRYNRMKDIALLKVDRTFKKPFKLTNNKSFTQLMEVYTIGAPKSISLGQSMSTGILSNERKANHNELLQLNMSVNPGNNGGPLFDKNGVLHGVISSKLSGFSTEGVGFAIPAYLISNYLNIDFN